MENEIFADHIATAGFRRTERWRAAHDRRRFAYYTTGMDGDMYVGKSPVPMTLEAAQQGAGEIRDLLHAVP